MQTQEFKERLNEFAEQVGRLPEPRREKLMAEIIDDLKWEISFAQSHDVLHEMIAEAEADIASGKSVSLAEGLAERRNKSKKR